MQLTRETVVLKLTHWYSYTQRPPHHWTNHVFYRSLQTFPRMDVVVVVVVVVGGVIVGIGEICGDNEGMTE